MRECPDCTQIYYDSTLNYCLDDMKCSGLQQTAIQRLVIGGSIQTRGDGSDLFRQVTVPTLVIHCQDDMAVDADEGRLLASTIPGARLVLLPSGTHYFPTDCDIADKVVSAIDRFIDG